MNVDYWPLRTAARNYYDSYQLTTRMSNRCKAAARQAEEGTGTYPIELDQQLEAAQGMKNASGVILARLYRNVAPPLVRQFQRETIGLGEMWLARLIGEVGDFKVYTEAWWEDTVEVAEAPDGTEYLQDEDGKNTPRPKRVLAIGEVRTTGVRELWAYCGHGDPERRRRRGQTQDDALASGNPLAKMIVHQMTEFALRNNGVPDKNGKERGQTPYYDAYLAARMTAENNHPEWKPGHVYNYAVRKVGKGILKDLWRVQHGEAPAYGARTEWNPARPVRQQVRA